jgi:hypothetical protein
MPRVVRLALQLYIGAALLTPVAGLFDPVPAGGAAGPGPAALLALLLPVLALKVLLLYKACGRRGWARIGLAVFTWLGIAAYMPGLVHSLRTAPPVGIVDLLLVLAEAIAVLLLFTRDANRWYRVGATATAGR